MADQLESAARSHIEGGVEAIVIGATLDGLVAAAYLARAGLKTVLLDGGSDIGMPIRRRVMSDGVYVTDGEHLLHALDPDVVEDLGVYRHGVGYAARRLDTFYHFDDQDPIRMNGDLQIVNESVEHDALQLERFLAEVLECARIMQPLLVGPIGAGSDPNKQFSMVARPVIQRLLSMLDESTDEILSRYFPDCSLRQALLSEAAFRSAVPPHEATSFSSLLVRWAGEVAGLQGAVAYPAGGPHAVIDALRRVAQRAKVDIRSSNAVTEILIEKDCAAGVSLASGGQMRAPIIISALNTEKTFFDLIGYASLDVESQRSFSFRRPSFGAVQLHLGLEDPGDDMSAEHFRHRNLYAPPPDALRRAFVAAQNGEIPEDLILEVLALSVVDADQAGGGDPLISVMAHPLPLDFYDNTRRRKDIKDSILSAFSRFTANTMLRIKEAELVVPVEFNANVESLSALSLAREGFVHQFGRAAATTAAAHIGGLYFCGPDAQIGFGFSGSAGRNAALAALQKSKRAGTAP